MVFNCKNFPAIFANRGNQSRHELRYHADEVGLPVFISCISTFTCRKPQILSRIEQKLLQRSQKVQFNACLQLRKPSQNEDQEDELTKIYANSLMTPVYSQGLVVAGCLRKLSK